MEKKEKGGREGGGRVVEGRGQKEDRDTAVLTKVVQQKLKVYATMLKGTLANTQ